MGQPNFLPYDDENEGRYNHAVWEPNRPSVPIHWYERRCKENETLISYAEFAKKHENSDEAEIITKLAFCAMPYVDERTFLERKSQLSVHKQNW